MGAKIEFDKTETKRIARHYGYGSGMSFLAAEYGVAVSTIRRVLIDEGVTIRLRGRPSLA